MSTKPTEADLLADITKKFGTPKSIEFSDEGNLIKLGFYGLVLNHIPPEICHLTHLRELDLRCNQLIALSPQLKNLINLRVLNLSFNKLTQLPSEIGQLTNLESLLLCNNQLSQIPSEAGQLTHLQTLDLGSSLRASDDLPAEFRASAGARKLYLSFKNQLKTLPSELYQLPHLQTLDLEDNQLSLLPSEINQLTSLRTLNISKNLLSHLPPELWQLINLRTLDVGNNELDHLPTALWRLSNLQSLGLTYNQLRQLPPEIGQLASLEQLFLGHNQLRQLPPEIGQLASLKYLYLHHNQLIELPPEIERLTNLQALTLGDNQFGRLPSVIWQVASLKRLNLDNCQLTSLPAELWQLPHLQELELDNNQLTFLPPEIGQLANLEKLQLMRNHLTTLPPEIGQLTKLRRFWLQGNRLRQLPSKMGHLTGLQELRLENNPDLLTPPPEIVTRGTKEILTFLHELQESSVIRYEAKLLVVGEGGTGKSSLLRALRDERFDPHSSTTHGIEIGQLELSSPRGTILLNTWDFGGQHIYHTTHQFFLTRRSLYLVVWNARLGAEQGRLHYWLETIKALAPDAPVLLVATHIDERTPDLNYQLYKEAYPQLTGHVGISNKNKAGLLKLKEVLTLQASHLPLMGQPWPQRWLSVEQTLQKHPEHHISAEMYLRCCSENTVEDFVAKGTLGNYLHDLGKVLYFHDDYVLCNLIVLKPNWVTKAISLVLTDEVVSQAHGILYHSELPRIWATDEQGVPYEPYLYPVFLRLMERFDLSYQIEADIPGNNATRSLIPQLLPYAPPIHLHPWPKRPARGQVQVEMVYRFDFVPTGIMSWFIVRTHRYSSNLHWRDGAILAYQSHQARVELNPMLRELRLLVSGVQPHNFFTILMHTIDCILSRFQGLVIRREIPCICHWKRKGTEPCTHYYHYEELVRRIEAKRNKIECPQTFMDVSVPTLLYGIHTSTDEKVMADIHLGQQKIEKRLDSLRKLDSILDKLQQQSELLVRNFTRQWNLEMQKLEAECPNTFILTLGRNNHFNPKNWVSQEYLLYLVCQHPQCPHQMGKGYPLRESEVWWVKLSPWLNHLIKFLKFGIPMGKAVGALYDEVDIDHFQTHIELLEQITQNIPMATAVDTLNNSVSQPQIDHEQRAVGSALRALHNFLIQADSSHTWGGLCKILTPDGNILWLCDTHRQQYEVKQLIL